ncbi:MAG TPA: 4-hydroxybutyrate CoA-transferase, partial [Candidatus Limnocylindria bacterium]|nr:4-hydroxybutyrate CoA-transferase [Candidatus Limnocylindria bacterium]
MRIVEAHEAVAGIRSNDQVFLHGGSAVPATLLDALVARADELTDVGMVHFHANGPGPHLAPEMASHFRH